jgi:ABC-2 type transport system ATP-binding protein
VNTGDTGGVRAERPADAAPQGAGGAPGEGWGVSGLSVTYGKTKALQDVSVWVPPRRVTAVVGGDGSGKSTLLRALAGLAPPSSGEVHSPGRDRIGFVSAQGGAYRDLTVDENLAFSGRSYGMASDALRERTELLLARTGLTEARYRLGGRLSGGMRQKLGVAMALLHEPPLLILDEPTTGVDPVSRVEVWRLISGAAAAGTAVLLSTTYIDEAERAAWVCVLDRGRALLAGTPDEVVDTVAGHICSIAVNGSRPACECWRDGASWRMYVPAGGQPPTGAALVEARLDDAVIAAALGLTGESRGDEEGGAA